MFLNETAILFEFGRSETSIRFLVINESVGKFNEESELFDGLGVAPSMNPSFPVRNAFVALRQNFFAVDGSNVISPLDTQNARAPTNLNGTVLCFGKHPRTGWAAKVAVIAIGELMGSLDFDTRQQEDCFETLKHLLGVGFDFMLLFESNSHVLYLRSESLESLKEQTPTP
jgi:hypothetical protein